MLYAPLPTTVEAFSFEEFIQLGRELSGVPVDKMPWSWRMHCCAVTHETDSLYLITDASGLQKTMAPHNVLVLKELGCVEIKDKEHFYNNYKRKTDTTPLTDCVNFNELAAIVHKANHKWWHDADGRRIKRNKGELLMLMVSELAEAMEGERKDLQDDKLPHRKMVDVEIADTLIRILDYVGGMSLQEGRRYDINGAFMEKMSYNETREDHTLEARMSAGGKKW